MKTKKYFQKFETFLLDILLPKKCLGCQKPETFFCDDCQKKIELNSFQVCPICQRSLTEYGEICRSCREFKPEIDSLTIATSYDNPLAAKAIHLFKYKFIEELSDPLSKLLIKTYQKNKLPVPDLIIPIPLHPLRLRWRGFNQSEILAKKISKNLLPDLTIKINNQILARIKFTLTQAHLKNFEDRQKNVNAAFWVNKKFASQIKNQRILLVDDVSTTGSTLFECAKELRQFKPKAIHAIVVARQK